MIYKQYMENFPPILTVIPNVYVKDIEKDESYKF